MQNSNISRRNFMTTMVSATTLPLVGLRASNASSKLPKAAVQYQEKPNNGEKCKNCIFWTDEDECTKVKGKILPQAWCNIFQPKGN